MRKTFFVRVALAFALGMAATAVTLLLFEQRADAHVDCYFNNDICGPTALCEWDPQMQMHRCMEQGESITPPSSRQETPSVVIIEPTQSRPPTMMEECRHALGDPEEFQSCKKLYVYGGVPRVTLMVPVLTLPSECTKLIGGEGVSRQFLIRVCCPLTRGRDCALLEGLAQPPIATPQPHVNCTLLVNENHPDCTP